MSEPDRQSENQASESEMVPHTAERPDIEDAASQEAVAGETAAMDAAPTWAEPLMQAPRIKSSLSELFDPETLPLDTSLPDEGIQTLRLPGSETTTSPVTTIFDPHPDNPPPEHRKPKMRPQDAEVLAHLSTSPTERYRLRDELGRGGMAVVFEAIDTDLRRRVAMKVLLDKHRKATARPDQRTPLKRFIEEAQITGQLEHPNIVPVHEIGVDDDGRVYFTMKRVEGRSLREVLDRMREGDEATLRDFGIFELMEIFVKVCDAVDFAHSRNVVHRDLKPDNVMVGRFGEVLVMDWGLAKIMGRADNDAATQTVGETISTGSVERQHTLDGTISGTPAYMPPEQARGEVNAIDHRSDVFTLGALLYELLTLVPPYHAKSSKEALRHAQRHELWPPRQAVERLFATGKLPDDTEVHPAAIARARHFPGELAAIAMHALAESPQDRYHTVRDLADDVERYLKHEPVSVHQDRPLAAISKWFGRHKVLAATGAGVVVMALAAALIMIVMFQQEAKERLHDLDALTREQQRAIDESILRQREQERAQALERQQQDAARRDYDRLKRLSAATAIASQAADLVHRAAVMSNRELAYHALLDARGLLGDALAIERDFPTAYLQRGYIELELGHLSGALADFIEGNRSARRNALKQDPASLMTAAMLVLTFEEVANLRPTGLDSFELLRQVKECAEPESDHAQLAGLLLRARSLFEGSAPLPSEAARALTAELETLKRPDQRMWEVYFFSGLFALLQNDAMLGQPVGDDEREAEIHRMVAEVESDFSHAIAIRPQLPTVVWHRVKLLRRLAQRQPVASNRRLESDDTAYRLWSDYIRQFPYDPFGFYARAASEGVSRDHAGHATRAMLDLHTALRLHPDFALARISLGTLLISEHDYDGALVQFRELEKAWETIADLECVRRSRNTVNGMEPMVRFVELLLARDLVQEAIEACHRVRVRYAARGRPYSRFFAHTLESVELSGRSVMLGELVPLLLPASPLPNDHLAAARAQARYGDFARARLHLEAAANGMARDDPHANELANLYEEVALLEEFAAGGEPTLPLALRASAFRLRAARRTLSDAEEARRQEAITLAPETATPLELAQAVRFIARELDPEEGIRRAMDKRTAWIILRFDTELQGRHVTPPTDPLYTSTISQAQRVLEG